MPIEMGQNNQVMAKCATPCAFILYRSILQYSLLFSKTLAQLKTIILTNYLLVPVQ
jgi:hypothetical protein